MEKIVTTEWRERERKRFEENIYKPVPWESSKWWQDCEYYDLHHAHVSIDEGKGLLAFTQDEDKGVNDRQTVMKPRRYLHKYLKKVIKDYISRDTSNFEFYWYQRNENNQHVVLPSKPDDVNLDDEVELWASRFEFLAKPTEYFRARTREEIKWVYLNCAEGASSCMSHPTCDYYTGGVHPAEAYGAGDIVIAYLKLWDKSSERELVTARAVTFPEKGFYGRIYGKYGNETKLKQALEDDGYEKGSMVDARMLKIPYVFEGSDNYVFPYLDNDCGVDYHSKGFFVITNYGTYEAQSEYGLLIKEPDWHCVSCDNGFRGDDYYNSNSGDAICHSCYEENYFTCHGCDEVFEWNEQSNEHKNAIYCNDCFTDVTTECIPCGERVADNEIAGKDSAGDMVCEDCKEEAGLVEDEHGVLVDPSEEPEPEEA